MCTSDCKCPKENEYTWDALDNDMVMTFQRNTSPIIVTNGNTKTYPFKWSNDPN